MPIYYAITWMRNKLYDARIMPSKSYNFPVVCVGNLSTGGTGKTPMIEYLIRFLKNDFKVATLSRGYGRKTRGFILSNESVTAEDIGDEPFQFYNKFKNEVAIAVDADRQNGIAKLHDLVAPDVILLDDAFQHRKVAAGFNILLTDFNKLYSKDVVLPTGNLREPKAGAKRASVIVVTKCPENLSETEKQAVVKSLNPLTHQQVFFSKIRYANEVYANDSRVDLEAFLKQRFILVTGIANPKPLVNYLNTLGADFEHLKFPDHHGFSKKEVELLAQKDRILTTEKDYMRLMTEERLKQKLFYLPIQVEFDRQKDFEDLVLNFIAP